MWVLCCNASLSLKKIISRWQSILKTKEFFVVVVSVLILLLPFSFIIRTDAMLTSGDISKLSDREIREKLIVQPGLSNDTPRKVLEVQLLNLKLDFLDQG